MVMITDLDLPVLPVEWPGFIADPFSFMAAARRQHPWLARIDAGYLVHGYEAVKELMFMDERLEPGLGGVVDFYHARDTLWGRFMAEIVLSQSGPTHTRLRASVARAFTPRHANQMRPLMRKVVSGLLDEWVPRGEFDFAEFAALFLVAVICALLGVSAEPIPRLRAAIDTHMSSLVLKPELKPAFLASFDVLWQFADSLIRDRELSGLVDENSLLDTLIATRHAGELDETELRFMVLTLLIAGYDTSKNMLTSTVHMLLKHPRMWERCAADTAFCAAVVEEMLRYSAIATPFRTVAQEFDYDGVRFPKGALLALAIPLTGHDPAVFPDPDTFDPQRSQPARHLAFGRGAHMCLGMHIARAQLEEGLHLIASRITRPRVAGTIGWRPFLGAWGPATLPLAFTAGRPG